MVAVLERPVDGTVQSSWPAMVAQVHHQKPGLEVVRQMPWGAEVVRRMPWGLEVVLTVAFEDLLPWQNQPH